MLRKLLIVFFVLLIVWALYQLIVYRTIRPTSPQSQTQPTQQPTGKPKNPVIIRVNSSSYAVFLQKITNPAKLTLIPNFLEKRTSGEIIQQHTCRFGTNGGFYTPEYAPVGLFITNSKTLGQTNTSTLTNGFFIKHTDNTLKLSLTPPTSGVAFALQSGPYMTPTTKLTIRNDEHARRVLVARTKNDEWYFIALTDQENHYEGPLLSEVPEVLGKLPQDVSEALNLDGGSASAFYSEKETKLGELTLIGSFFCGI